MKLPGMRTAVAVAGTALALGLPPAAAEAGNDPADTAAGGISGDAWPRSWFEPPRTASELGIDRFRQSPLLDAEVAAGDLPPVEERLPEDPVVAEPYAAIGRYGGTASIFDRAPGSSTRPRGRTGSGRSCAATCRTSPRAPSSATAGAP